jgi:hypothetical protein
MRAIPSRELADRPLPNWRRTSCYPDSSTLLSLGMLDLNSAPHPDCSLLWACRPSAARWIVHCLLSRFFHAPRSSLDEVGVLTATANLEEKNLLPASLSPICFAHCFSLVRLVSRRLALLQVRQPPLRCPPGDSSRGSVVVKSRVDLADVSWFLFGSSRAWRRQLLVSQGLEAVVEHCA